MSATTSPLHVGVASVAHNLEAIGALVSATEIRTCTLEARISSIIKAGSLVHESGGPGMSSAKDSSGEKA